MRSLRVSFATSTRTAGPLLAALIAAGLLVAAAYAQPRGPRSEPSPREQAYAAVEKVRMLLQEGNLGEAFREAAAATQADPSYAAAWRALAYCHQLRGNDVQDDRELAIECYARSLSLEDYEQARRQIHRIVQSGRYPRWVSERALDYLPGAFERRRFSLRDPRLDPALRRDYVVAVSTAHQYPEQVPKRHPLYGETFAGVTYAFVSDPEDGAGRLKLMARVFYPTDTLSRVGRDYTREASLSAEWVARLLTYYSAYLGTTRTQRLSLPLSTYLAEGAPTEPPGLRREVGVFEVEVDRTPEEWVLDLCAGLGYVGLPAVGPFQTEEVWATGDIARALFMKWVFLNSVDGIANWGEAQIEPAAYLKAKGEPALQAFLACVPNAEDLADPFEEGYERAVGLALFAESILPPEGLTKVLRLGETTDAQTLLWNTADLLKEASPGQFRVPGGLFGVAGSDPGKPFDILTADFGPAVMLPHRPLRYRVFLREGHWGLTVAASGPDAEERPTRISVVLDGGPRRPSIQRELVLRSGRTLASGDLGEIVAGWYDVVLRHDNDLGTVNLQSLALAEREAPIP